MGSRARIPLVPPVFAHLDNALRQWQGSIVSDAKLDQLKSLLCSYESCLVAYSGGVDSVFLARVAHEVLGDRCLAVIADSPSLPRRELEEALALAREFHFPIRVVQTAEFADEKYLANPVNRCYFCKHELFNKLEPLARTLGFKVIAYGENASDLGDFRPGSQAAREFHVRAPLKEVGMTKAEIRDLSARLGLPTADKPQMACLSSRIPYGEAVTPEKLRMIEAAEYILQDVGFVELRVRHHELPAAPDSAARHLARIEVGTGELGRLLEGDLAGRIAEAIRKVGYSHVTVDLQGYRRGSLNEPAPIQLKARAMDS